MADFNIRSDSVDVEQIMKQIRARITEKRGVDYTEDQIREIAAVRLEKFLDPKSLRSDLLEQFRRSRPAIPADPPPVEAPYEFSDETLVSTHRGGLRFIRKLLQPILKLFFNLNTLNQVLHTQAQFNVDLMKREQRRKIEFDRSRADWNALYYEVLHNLVLETTRNGIELKNLKMRVEALASRLDFSERRVRALEGVVQYRPEIVRPRPAERREGQRDGQGGGRGPAPGRPRDEAPADAGGETVEAPPPDASVGSPATATPQTGEASGRRRRRRRRGRRGAGMVPGVGPAASNEPLGGDAAGDDDLEGDESDASEELGAIAADDLQSQADANDDGPGYDEPSADDRSIDAPRDDESADPVDPPDSEQQ